MHSSKWAASLRHSVTLSLDILHLLGYYPMFGYTCQLIITLINCEIVVNFLQMC